jgi:phosphatidylglycerophosphate synthase|tara:strand:+ start:577 stop:1242 length:666 start_codon:yes stop_codon:yes gene_type:complete
MGKTNKIGRENENWLAKYVYRKIASPLVIQLSKINVTSVQISIVSIITSIIAGIFFSLGNWESLVIGYIFLQLTIILDHVDGAIARYTNNQTIVGSWFDKFGNKLHKFFFVFGVTLGVYKITNEPFYLILGNIAGFLWIFSLYISETKKILFELKKDITLFKESRFKTVFPFTLLVVNIFGFLVLINQAILSLWFIIILSLNAFQQIYTVRKHHYKEKWRK